MSSIDLPLSKSNRLSCTLCVDGTYPLHDDEIKRLDELLMDVEKLKIEKMDLLKQNVTCRTDIKKLKERFLIIA